MNATLTVRDGRLRVRTPYAPALVERFRAIPGRSFDGETKEWTFPIAPDVVSMVTDVLGVLPWSLPPEVRDAVNGSLPRVEAKPVDMSLIEGHVFRTVPFEHQRVNLARLVAEKRWLIADEQGLGKSAVIANRLRHVKNQLDILNVLIVCPKSVVHGWLDQLWTHAELHATAVEGNATQRRNRLAGGFRFKVTNYEALIHTGSAFEEIDWDVVVIDEVQKVKNFTAQTSKALRRLTAKANYVWALSGTPAPNGLEDYLGVLAAVDPKLLPVQTKTAVEARYCVKQAIGQDDAGNPAPPFKIVAYRNVAELHGYIARITSRHTKAECLDLPPKIFSVRTCQLEGEQARVYRDIKKDAVAKIETLRGEGTLTVANVITESLRLLQVVGGHMPLLLDSHDTDCDCSRDSIYRFPKIAKLDALGDLLDEVGERQVVLWACFRPEVAMLVEWLEKHYGGGVASLVGGMSGNDRAENIERFRSGAARWFVGTAEAGGTGVNGLAVADTMVYYSRGWRLDSFLQSQDRGHRIGMQGNSLSIVKLLAERTVDFKVDESLDKKQSLQDMMLGNPAEVFG